MNSSSSDYHIFTTDSSKSAPLGFWPMILGLVLPLHPFIGSTHRNRRYREITRSTLPIVMFESWVQVIVLPLSTTSCLGPSFYWLVVVCMGSGSIIFFWKHHAGHVFDPKTTWSSRWDCQSLILQSSVFLLSLENGGRFVANTREYIYIGTLGFPQSFRLVHTIHARFAFRHSYPI